VSATQWANDVQVKPIGSTAAPGSPALTISLSIATSSQRPRSPLMRKAIEVIRDIVRHEITSSRKTHAGLNGTEKSS